MQNITTQKYESNILVAIKTKLVDKISKSSANFDKKRNLATFIDLDAPLPGHLNTLFIISLYILNSVSILNSVVVVKSVNEKDSIEAAM